MKNKLLLSSVFLFFSSLAITCENFSGTYALKNENGYYIEIEQMNCEKIVLKEFASLSPKPKITNVIADGLTYKEVLEEGVVTYSVFSITNTISETGRMEFSGLPGEWPTRYYTESWSLLNRNILVHHNTLVNADGSDESGLRRVYIRTSN